MPPPLVAILEDDPSSADALEMILTDWGAAVVHALNAEALTAQLGSRIGELRYLISDYNIEGHPNGVDAARALLKQTPLMRVLILTGTFRRRAEAVAAAAGFDVLFKPARAADIINWLERAP